MSKVRLTGSTSGYTEITAPAVGGNNTIVLPSGNGSANQLLKNGATAGTLEYASVTASGTALGSVASINNGPLAGMRNAIINGNFDIWQRGTSFTGLEYTADRWLLSRNGTTHTTSRQSFTLGQTDVPGEPRFFWRCVTSSVAGAGNFLAVLQSIEGVRTFAGQQVTVSFWAKADASKPISIELRQAFGTGGSPSAEVTAIGVTKTTLTTTWQKITATATVPSIAAKTLGSDGNDKLDLIIWFDAGSNFNSRTDTLGQQSGTFDIAQVQVEPGPIATQFERRPIGMELSLCQRYYQYARGYMGGYAPGPGAVTAAYQSANLVEMRTTPAVAILSTEAIGCTNPTILAIGVDHWRFTCSATGAFIGGAVASLSAEV